MCTVDALSFRLPMVLLVRTQKTEHRIVGLLLAVRIVMSLAHIALADVPEIATNSRMDFLRRP